ncbi:hypothetical protein BST61_g1755 [Cercospora zeina]
MSRRCRRSRLLGAISGNSLFFYTSPELVRFYTVRATARSSNSRLVTVTPMDAAVLTAHAVEMLSNDACQGTAAQGESSCRTAHTTLNCLVIRGIYFRLGDWITGQFASST